MQSNPNSNRLESSAEGSAKPINVEAGRRAFVQSLGLGLAGTAIFGGTVAGPSAAKAAAPAQVTDADILNFALNLEYLEAEFYLRASTGSGLTSDEVSGVGTVGAVSGGRQVKFDTKAFENYAKEIADDEHAHVLTLRKGLGGSAVARPAIDLNMSFTTAAQAAGLIKSGETFDAFANETNFLLAAFIFEDVGVTAYYGAAPMLSPAYLPTAAGILAVEAYHAGIIRTTLYGLGQFYAAGKISNARDSLDGKTDLDQYIGNASVANLVPTDSRGIVKQRTTSQVLDIVYLSPTAAHGGFFPNGLNGSIN